MQQPSERTASKRIPRTEDAPNHDVRGNVARASVLVVEDEAAYGRCLLRTIERCGGTATLIETVREAHEQLARGGPFTGLIVDVLLPDSSGLDFLSEVRDSGVNVPALIISGLRDNAIARAAFGLDALYLVKPVDAIYVESLVHHASGEAVLVSRALDEPAKHCELAATYGTVQQRYPHLSPRERETLALLLQGLSDAEIAVQLSISRHTVNQYTKSIYTRLGIHSRGGLHAWARTTSLVLGK